MFVLMDNAGRFLAMSGYPVEWASSVNYARRFPNREAVEAILLPESGERAVSVAEIEDNRRWSERVDAAERADNEGDGNDSS